MVAEADAGGEPGAVMVHLEDAAPAGRAVVRAVRFPSLALLTEPGLAVGFYGKGCSARGVDGR